MGALNVLGGKTALLGGFQSHVMFRVSQPVRVLAVWKQCKMAAGGEIFPPLVRMIKFQFDGWTGLGWRFNSFQQALGSELTTFWLVMKQFPVDCWIIIH